jgi:hypothetical protein
MADKEKQEGKTSGNPEGQGRVIDPAAYAGVQRTLNEIIGATGAKTREEAMDWIKTQRASAAGGTPKKEDAPAAAAEEPSIEADIPPMPRAEDYKDDFGEVDTEKLNADMAVWHRKVARAEARAEFLSRDAASEKDVLAAEVEALPPFLVPSDADKTYVADMIRRSARDANKGKPVTAKEIRAAAARIKDWLERATAAKLQAGDAGAERNRSEEPPPLGTAPGAKPSADQKKPEDYTPADLDALGRQAQQNLEQSRRVRV